MNSVFYELKFSGKLPSPAGVGGQILQLTQKEDSGLDEITRVVRADPSLAGRVLKVANAVAFTGGPAATTLEEAVLRLGFEALRGLVLGFSLISPRPTVRCRAFDYNAFWHVSLGRAVAAQQLTELCGRGSGSESYVCGLLCSIGRLALAAAHPDGYSCVLENDDAANPESLVALETAAFGINHRELTEALLLDWGFPQRLARAAATWQQSPPPESAEPDPLALLRRILSLADRVVDELDAAGAAAEALSEETRNGLAVLGMNEAQVTLAQAAIRAARAEWGALLNLSAPRRAAHSDASAPAACAGARPVAEVRDAGRPSSTCGLLLLERDDRTAAGFQAWLKPAGCAALRARSVRDALMLAVSHAPQIVIAHGYPDDTEALELCKALRSFEAGRLVFFILATSHRDPQRLLAAFDTGVDDYLVLPCCEGDGLLRLRAAQRVLQLRALVATQETTLEQNLAELAVANRKLHRVAMTDELTQLPNRRFAEETLREEWESAGLKQQDLSLLVGDIDHFKRVNDTHGHLVGDIVLASVARVLRQELRATDIACRLGGEEFLVVCPNTDLAAARRCAERVREKVAATEVALSGRSAQVTISLGVASLRASPVPVTSVEGLLQAADDAVYESKCTGRNRVSVARAA